MEVVAISELVRWVLFLSIGIVSLGYVLFIIGIVTKSLKKIGFSKEFTLIRNWIDVGYRVLDKTDPEFEEKILDFTLRHVKQTGLVKNLSVQEMHNFILDILKEMKKEK